MGAYDWDNVFARVGQIRSTGEANRLLNTISMSFGIQHFRVAEYHFVLAASVGREAPSPLHAEAASLFDSLLRHNAGALAGRLQTTNEPFWTGGTETGDPSPPKIPSLLCCPIRYGQSAKTAGLFLSKSENIEFADAICLQGALVRLLERFLELRTISDPSDQTLNQRERICLDLFSRGLDFTMIAEKLDLPEQAVAACMNIADSRLRARNLSHAVAIAIRSKII